MNLGSSGAVPVAPNKLQVEARFQPGKSLPGTTHQYMNPTEEIKWNQSTIQVLIKIPDPTMPGKKCTKCRFWGSNYRLRGVSQFAVSTWPSERVQGCAQAEKIRGCGVQGHPLP